MKLPSLSGKFLNIIKSYACGTAPRGRFTFKVFFGNFFTVQSLRPNMVIPTKKSIATYVLNRLPSKVSWAEKKFISHWPFCEFCPKIEIKWL